MIIKNKDIKNITKKSTYIKRIDISNLKSGSVKVVKINKNN